MEELLPLVLQLTNPEQVGSWHGIDCVLPREVVLSGLLSPAVVSSCST
jgi:hypothetical protein